MLEGFISHSHVDAPLCRELQVHLGGFKRENRARFWSDHAIDAGTQWRRAVLQALEEAEIALLLLSADFYASEFIWKDEMPRINERRREGKLTVVSIRARAGYDPNLPNYEWLRDEQQVPRGGWAVASRPNRDEAWQEVIVEINRILERLLQQREASISNCRDVWRGWRRR